MTYKGVYRDGVVFLSGDVDLRNGEAVEVNSAKAKKPAKARGAAATSPKSRTTAKRPKATDRLPAFGIWKDRWPASMSSAQIARELREQVSRRAR